MKKNKSGFISMTLVYTFLIVFMFLMLAILRTYTEKDKFLQTINDQIDQDISVAKGSRTTIINKLLEDNGVMSDAGIFYFKVANGATGNGNGLFYLLDETYTDENNDDNKTRIYYFRGDVDNNHIVFANLCFRIIRINDDGSIRIIYNGSYENNKCPKTGEGTPNIGKTIFSNNGVSYVEPDGSSLPMADIENNQSPIINILNAWYEDNFLRAKPSGDDFYTVDIAKTAIYCNNKELYQTVDTTQYYTAKGLVPTYINPNVQDKYDNTNIKNTIDFRCQSSLDKFNAYDRTLLYPVGLITAQDVVLAGGYLTTDDDLYKGGPGNLMSNESYYLYSGQDYWTMSPLSSDTVSKVVYVNTDGQMLGGNVTAEHYIRPVISLNPNITIETGNGTSNSPYIVK